jgi:hypothetical protein
MYLVEAKSAVAQPLEELRDAPRLLSDPWVDFPASYLSHHGLACCETAREWLVAMDFAQLNGAELTSGPRWLRARYKWGPSPWPMHWCDAVRRKNIDCGVHAAMSRELFRARGLTAFPAQLVQLYSEDAIDQWRGKWTEEEASCHWLDGEYIYHEATALLGANSEIKIWDASSASWLDPPQAGAGYGSVVALRVMTDEAPDAGLTWGQRPIASNVWNQL